MGEQHRSVSGRETQERQHPGEPRQPHQGHGRVTWLLTHERVRHTPRVRAVIDFLYERLSVMSGHFDDLRKKLEDRGLDA